MLVRLSLLVHTHRIFGHSAETDALRFHFTRSMFVILGDRVGMFGGMLDVRFVVGWPHSERFAL